MDPDAGLFDGFFGVFLVLVIVIFVAILGAILLAVVRGAGEWSRNNQEPVTSGPATVVAKRDQHRVATSDRPSSTTYFVTFELSDGSRREFPLPAKEYGLLAERDRGELTYQGTRYKGFTRLLEER